MDYELFIKKSLQFHQHTYCFVQKPFLSFDFDFKNTIDSTDFYYNTNISQSQRGAKWNSLLHITAFKYKYPKVSLWVLSNRTLSLHISNKKYKFIINSVHPSITLNLSPDDLLNYQISASFFSSPSVIGSFSYKNLLMSIHFYDEKISLAYQIKSDKIEIGCGFKIKKSNSILDFVTDSFSGIKIPLLQNQFLSITSGFVSDSYKIALAFQNINHKITYSYINSPIFNGEDYDFASFYLLQYKYILNNGNKLAFLYPLFTKSLYLRGSFHIYDKLKVRLTAKLDNNEGSFHFNPTFGFLFNLNQIADFLK